MKIQFHSSISEQFQTVCFIRNFFITWVRFLLWALLWTARQCIFLSYILSPLQFSLFYQTSDHTMPKIHVHTSRNHPAVCQDKATRLFVSLVNRLKVNMFSLIQAISFLPCHTCFFTSSQIHFSPNNPSILSPYIWPGTGTALPISFNEKNMATVDLYWDFCLVTVIGDDGKQ